MTWVLLVPPLLGYLLWERVQGAEHRDVAEALGMALPLGTGVTAFAALALEPFGAGLGSVGLTAALVLAALAALATRKRPTAGAAPGAGMPVVAWAGAVVVAGQSALAVAVVVADGRFADWDAWAIWDMKARAFHADGGVSGYLSRAPDLAFSWPSRPPLTSLVQAFVYTCLGGASETAGRLVHVATYASLLLLFFALVRRSAGAGVAALSAAFLASAPNVAYHASSGVANLALGVYVLALVVALERGLARGGPRALVAAGAFAGFAALSRDEGRWLALAALGAASLVGLVQGRAVRRIAGGALLCGAVAALVYAPWAAAVTRSGAEGMLSDWSLADTWSRLPAHLRDVPAFLGMLARELFLPVEQTAVSPVEEALGVALFWPTFLVALAVLPFARRRDPLAWSAALTSVLGFGLYAAGLWLFPYDDLADLQHHWIYVLDRHLIAVVPAAAYAIASVLAPRERPAASATNAAPSTPSSVSQPPTATERGA